MMTVTEMMMRMVVSTIAPLLSMTMMKTGGRESPGLGRVTFPSFGLQPTTVVLGPAKAPAPALGSPAGRLSSAASAFLSTPSRRCRILQQTEPSMSKTRVCRDIARTGLVSDTCLLQYVMVEPSPLLRLRSGYSTQSNLDSQELPDLGAKTPVPFPAFLPVSYQIRDADYFLLKEEGQEFMRNSSMQTHTQPFVLLRASRQPAVAAAYGPLSIERPVPPGLVRSASLFHAPGAFTYNWRVQSFVLTPRVCSSKPKVRVLFYVAGRDWGRGPEGASDELPCVTVYAFWQTQEVRGSCTMGGQRGTCMAELEPEPGWFSPGAESSSRERLDPSSGNPVELYYQARPSVQGRCGRSGDGARWGGGDGKISSEQLQQEAEHVPVTPMERIGSVRLLQVPKGTATLSRLKLGNAIVIRTSSKPLKKTDIATFFVLMASSSSLQNFTLRATVRKGVTFRTATPSNSLLWDITLDMGGDGVVAVACQRKSPAAGKRPDSSLLEVLQMDFVVEELSSPLDSQVLVWKLELPLGLGEGLKTEGAMRIYTTQRDFVGLAPLIMDTEVLNTAILTGKKVVLPVRTVAVEEDGLVTDVSDYTDCVSSDEDVLKVSDRCDYVFVNGKETKGKVKMTVNFTYSYLVAQLELNVWIPRLPLQIEVSDTELSQIKGWRVPIVTSKKPSWNSEEDDGDRKGIKGCMLQFQHALVRVFTHFTADQADPRDPEACFLGSDWQVDVTRLVRYFLKVEDPRVARLQAGRVLSGRDVGTTSVLVFSPLSDTILGQKTVTVVDDKVTITELGVQLVTGLSLSLQLSPGSNRAVLATATTQEVLQSPKQEAVVSSWLQFSDGSLTPLEVYDPASFRLTVTSLDEGVVSVQGSPSVAVVAVGEGQGVLVRAEMTICQVCQKTKRKSTLAVGTGSLRVKFPARGPSSDSGNGSADSVGSNNSSPSGGGVNKDSSSDYGNDGEELDLESKQQQQPPPRDPRPGGPDQREESALLKRTTTVKSAPPVGGSLGGVGKNRDAGAASDAARRPGLPRGDSVGVGEPGGVVFASTVKPPGNLVNLNNPASGAEVEEDMLAGRPLTDLEIGMYALLAVFCLAILVFLVNCVSYVVKFRHKKPPSHGQEPAGHRHDWVWLGTDAELVMNVPGSPMSRENPRSATTVIDIGPDKAASLPRRPSCLASVTDSPLGCAGRSKAQRSDSIHSPTSKRKRVQFTTFASLDRQQQQSPPHISPRQNGHAGGIHWVGRPDNCLEDNAVPVSEPENQRQ
ncbi:transmembrane protein 132D [Aplochiton taeniatus]